MSKDDTAESGSTLGGAYEKVTERVGAAYSSAREVATDAAHSTAAGIETNPLAALIGGLALGAIAGAMIPRLAKEKELLEPLGARLGEAARAALDAGRTAGTQAFADAGLGTDDLRAQVSKLMEQAFSAAGTVGTAALKAARESTTR